MPPLAVGLVGSVLVATGASSLRFSLAPSWGWEPVDRLGGSITPSAGEWLLALGLLLMLAAWWSVRPWRHGTVHRPWLVFVVWVAPLRSCPRC